jgi:hypothetical protein
MVLRRHRRRAAGAALTNTCLMGTPLSKLPFNRTARCDIDTVVRQLVGADRYGHDPPPLVAATVIGVTLGLLGGGGSILTVPILVRVAGVPAKKHAMSLFVVAVTAARRPPHARAGRVRCAPAPSSASRHDWRSPAAALIHPRQWLRRLRRHDAGHRRRTLHGRRTRTDRPARGSYRSEGCCSTVSSSACHRLAGAGGGFLVASPSPCSVACPWRPPSAPPCSSSP